MSDDDLVKNWFKNNDISPPSIEEIRYFKNSYTFAILAFRNAVKELFELIVKKLPFIK